MVTDEFLKVYLARPELTPPPEACVVERTLHAALLDRSAPAVTAAEIAAIADADARENWQVMLGVPRSPDRATGPGGGLSRYRAPRRQAYSAICSSINWCT